MLRFIKRINGTVAALLCAVIVLSFTVDFGKYPSKELSGVDYSKYFEEYSVDDVLANISLDDNQVLLQYAVSDRDMGYIYGNSAQALYPNENSSYVCAYSNPNYRFVKWSDGSTEPKRRDTVGENTVITAEFEYVGLPEIHITVPEISGGIGKEYSSASVSLSNVEERYSFDSSSAKIRIRGNSSSRFDKKSYKVKFSEKVNLLGLGGEKRKDWVLVANHCDQTLMRNFFAYNLAQSFDGLERAYNCAQVEVYLNGKYNGVYLLTEQVETGKSRVDIDTEGVNDDIGFLLELDSREALDSGECIKIDRLRFAIRSDFTTDGQYNYAKNYLMKCNEAIKHGDKEEIESLIDVDSFVDMYLLQEYVKNFDVGFASLFMYIKEDGGKLYFGPAWDFDISMGNDDRTDDGGFENLFVGEKRGFGIGHEWFILVMRQEWFREKAKERYVQLYPEIKENISNTVKYYLENKTELEANFDVWEIFGDRILFEPETVVANKTYDEHFRHLVLWLEGRSDWLYEYYQSEEFINKDEDIFDILKDIG